MGETAVEIDDVIRRDILASDETDILVWRVKVTQHAKVELGMPVVIPNGCGTMADHEYRYYTSYNDGNHEYYMSVSTKKNMKMESVPSEDYNKGFYQGDVYLILNPRLKSQNALIHILQGIDSTEDEKFYGAIQSVQLDSLLGGSPRQIAEVQGHESSEFKTMFDGVNGPCLRWKKGGYKTSLTSTKKQEVVQLFEVKGKKNVRATEVELSESSMNSGDSYVLDAGNKIYVICGKEANMYEARKAILVANNIRDYERAGKAHVTIVEENDLNTEDPSALAVRKYLKSGTTRFIQLRPATSDEAQEKKYLQNTVLHKISDAEGSIKIKELDGPLSMKQLDTNDCFLLETGGNIYLWRGRNSNMRERRESFRIAESFKKEKNLPSWLTVEVLNEFSEHAAFRSCFPDWVDRNAQQGLGKAYTNNNIAKRYTKQVDVKKFHGTTVQSVIDPYSNDDGSSQAVRIYRVNNRGGLVEWPIRMKGIFYSGDSYVITYEYGTTSKKCIIYYWQGNDSDVVEKGAAAKMASAIDDKEYAQNAVQERVIEGKEPPHFLRIFDGKLIVYQGDHEKCLTENTRIRLFHVRGKREREARAVEVAPVATNLNSSDTFVLDMTDKVILWYGRGSTGDERQIAQDAALHINPKHGGDYSYVYEGEENNEFWNGIGGKKPYASQQLDVLQVDAPAHEPRLFHCFNKRGSLEVEEIHEFNEEDLISDDVMFLDAYHRVYIWIGVEAKKNELKETIDFIQKYIKSDPTPRTDVSTLSVIKQGHEPDHFKAFFGVWEGKTKTDETLKQMKHRVHDSNKEIQLFSQVEPAKLYKLSELTVPTDDLPEDVEHHCREEFLDDDDFCKIFKMTKADFRKKPSWKKDQLKKDADLF